MPNHVTTRCIVHGPQQDRAAFFAAHITEEDGKPRFDFNTVIRPPPYMEDTHSGSGDEDFARYPLNGRAKTETGHKNWYDWNTARWGTKWNAYAFEYIEQGVSFRFDTAWSFPMPVFEALVARWPTLSFECDSFDEGWWFAWTGTMGGGSTLRRVDRPDPGKDPEGALLYERAYGEPFEGCADE